MFKKNEFVAYPPFGIAKVTNINELEVSGYKDTFFEFSFLNRTGKAKIPKNKLERNRIRKLSSKEEIGMAIEELKLKKEILDPEEGRERINSGTIIDLAKNIRDFFEIGEKTIEKVTIYDQSLNSFIYEAAVVGKMEPKVIAEKIIKILDPNNEGRKIIYQNWDEFE